MDKVIRNRMSCQDTAQLKRSRVIDGMAKSTRIRHDTHQQVGSNAFREVLYAVMQDDFGHNFRRTGYTSF